MSGYVVEGRVASAPNSVVELVTGVGRRTQACRPTRTGASRPSSTSSAPGGGERLAQRFGFPLLGRVPLNPVVRVGGDAGDPVR
jgi:hypothetical protein